MANNKPLSNDNTMEVDAYDELLTQEEIQDHIDKINQLLALELIETNVQNSDVKGLQRSLRNPFLVLEDDVQKVVRVDEITYRITSNNIPPLIIPAPLKQKKV